MGTRPKRRRPASVSARATFQAYIVGLMSRRLRLPGPNAFWRSARAPVPDGILPRWRRKSMPSNALNFSPPTAKTGCSTWLQNIRFLLGDCSLVAAAAPYTPRTHRARRQSQIPIAATRSSCRRWNSRRLPSVRHRNSTWPLAPDQRRADRAARRRMLVVKLITAARATRLKRAPSERGHSDSAHLRSPPHSRPRRGVALVFRSCS